MPKVTIKSIAKQSTMSDEDFAYIKKRINKPLNLLSISFRRNEPHGVFAFAIYTNTYEGCISLFPTEQGIDFEVDYDD